jgi:hypothetical protein
VRREGYFSSNPKHLNFRVEVEKKRCEPLSLFWLLDFDGTTSVVSPWCPCAEHFLIEEVLDVRRGVRVFV